MSQTETSGEGSGAREERLLMRVDEFRSRATRGLDHLIDEVHRHVGNTRSRLNSAVGDRAPTLPEIEGS